VNEVVGLPIMSGHNIKFLLDTGCSLYVGIPRAIVAQMFEIEDIYLNTQRVSKELKMFQKL
jgi:hypothetical protein